MCVRAADGSGRWEKAIEVRNKPVATSDVRIFGKKCVDLGVREAALAMVSERQEQLDQHVLTKWADRFGIGVTLFHGWQEIVDQALFWSAEPKTLAAGLAARFIHERLIGVEASPASVQLWQTLIADGDLAGG